MKIYLYGCGGHAKVILDILNRNNQKVTAIVDDNPPPELKEIHHTPVYKTSDYLDKIKSNSQWIVTIGNNKIRQKIALKLENLGYSFINAIHPSAQIGLGVKINLGTVIMANVVINIDTYIGNHVIINTGATIDHDCYIADYCHIAPGCSICGGVTINQGVLLGVGTKIKPCIEIGKNTICGAGSVIVKNLPSDCLVYGCPATVIKNLEP